MLTLIVSARVKPTRTSQSFTLFFKNTLLSFKVTTSVMKEKNVLVDNNGDVKGVGS